MASAALITTCLQTLIVASAWNSNAPVKDAIDYKISMFAPARGLLAGLNPYNPLSSEYLHTFANGTVASLHTPSILVLSAPATLLPFKIGYFVLVVASALMMWAAVIVLIRPTNNRTLVIAVVTGVLLTMSGPSDEVLRLGQVTAFAVLGLALLLRYPGGWTGAIGLVLVITTPQFGIPLSILFVGLGYWRTIVRAWLVTILLSLPALIVAIAADGFGAFVRGVEANLRDANSSGNATNRLDFVGRFASGNTIVTVLVVLATIGLAWFLWHHKIELTPELAMGIVCFCLLFYFSMPYSLPLALLAGASVIAESQKWHILDWLVLALALLAVPATIVFATPLSRVAGISVGQFWLGFTLLEALVMFGILIVVAQRTISSRRHGGASLVPAG